MKFQIILEKGMFLKNSEVSSLLRGLSMEKICIGNYHDANSSLAIMLSSFEYGELNHNQVVALFQEILNSELYYMIGDSMKNAIEVYVRNGLVVKSQRNWKE